MPHEFVLGNPIRSEKADVLREGALSFRSRKGLALPQRLLIEHLPRQVKGRVLTGLDSEGAVAMACSALYGHGSVDFISFDVYLADKVRLGFVQNGLPSAAVQLGTDLPGTPPPGVHGFLDEGYGMVALCFPASAESALTRELIEQAHAILRPGGVLQIGTNHKTGDWLAKTVKGVFGDATRLPLPKQGGALVSARRRKPRAKLKDHSHVSVISDCGPRVEVRTRPGVFGYRRFDEGTRALLEAARVGPGQRVVDIGCGPGTIGLILGKRTGAPVQLVDSSRRATALAEENAARNGVEAEVLTAADLFAAPPDVADHVFCNPPYYSNYRIAESFVLSARRVLKPGGKLWLVAKNHDAHGQLVAEMFADPQLELLRGYGVITGFKPIEV